MMKLGLKIWSTNLGYLPEIERLLGKEVFDYIEIFPVPGSLEKTAKVWRDLGIETVIHAPHFAFGVNLAHKDEKSLDLIKEALEYATFMEAEAVIVHPGFDGSRERVIDNLLKLDDKRLVVENMPYLILDSKVSQGALAKDLEVILTETGLRFCLDIGHAICSANARKMEQFGFIEDLIKLKPYMFHLSDGDFEGTRDQHLNFGKGNFPIKGILQLIPKTAEISIETNKKSEEKLEDFEEDVIALKNL